PWTPAAIRTYGAHAPCRREGEVRAADEMSVSQGLGQYTGDEKPPVPPLGGREVDAHGPGGGAGSSVVELRDEPARLLDTSLGLGGARLGAPAEPGDLASDRVGERFLVGGLPAHVVVAASEEVAVASVGLA